MTRRRNSSSSRPSPGSSRPTGRKKEDNTDSELRQARAVKKAEAQEKQRLRRHDFSPEPDEDLDKDLGDAEELDLGKGLWDDGFGETKDGELSEDEESET